MNLWYNRQDRKVLEHPTASDQHSIRSTEMATPEYTTKRCIKCAQEYPSTAEYFYPNKSYKCGLSSKCKTCTRQDTKTWQDAHPEKVREFKKKSAENNREKINAKLRDKWHNDPVFRAKHYQRGLDWKRRNPGYERDELKTRASTALSNAVRLGKFPPAKAYDCEKCGQPAKHYHHESYEPEHWFDVIPLCTKCHGLTWRKNNG